MRRIHLILFLSISLTGLSQTASQKKIAINKKLNATTTASTTKNAASETKKTQTTVNSTKTTKSSNANYPLGIGKVQLNTGVGASTWGFPVYAGLDIGITKDISIGFEASYRVHDYGRYSYYYYNNTNQKTAVLGFMANGNYHFNKLLKLQKKFDLYAGVSAGYMLRLDEKNSEVYNGISYNYTSPYESGLNANIQAGARYFLNDHLALHSQLEAGNFNQGIKVGITYKP